MNTKNKIILFFSSFFLFTTLFCYSVEFRPYQGYPVQKKSNIECVKLRFKAPKWKHNNIGELLIYDASLDMQDPNFRLFLEKEIKRRGAQGGYVTRYKITKKESFRTGLYDNRRDYTETGKINVKIHTLKIILYNYTDNLINECNK